METEPARMTAAEASALIQAKQLSCEELTRSCLARIGARDAVVRAWLSLDPDHAIRRARELDKLPWKGPLHGIPWGVKDVIDSADYPTTQNSPIYDGLRMGRDAAPVAVVRGSGALVLGKTDTVEFASSGRKALTTNPYNSGPYAGRVVVRFGRRRRGFPGATRVWHPNRRLAHPACLLQRHLRPEAELGPGQPGRRANGLADARHHRLVRTKRRGSGAGGGRVPDRAR